MTQRTYAAFAFLLIATLLINLNYIRRCENGLSPFADAYSEANALRAGELFASRGFTTNCGLPDVAFGDRYPSLGIHESSGKDQTDTVYHGYPPGSDWLAGVYIKALGVDHVGRFRYVPVAIGVAAAATFLAALTLTLGAEKGLCVYLGCLLAPMFTNMTHGLYYHGYALSLLLFELAVLLMALRRPGRLGAGPVLTIFLLGFLQGWLSFDYCFVVTFAAAPVALLVAKPDEPVGWRKVFVLVMAAGLGFVAAHALHFLQSAFYFGSVREAVQEYAFRSGKKYGIRGSGLEAMSRAELLRYALYYYGVVYVRWTHLFSPTSLLVLPLTAAVFVLRRASFTVGNRLTVWMEMGPNGRDAAALALALLIGLGWMFVKPFHAMNHAVFGGRLLFLFYFVGCFVIARATSTVISREPAPWPNATGQDHETATEPGEQILSVG